MMGDEVSTTSVETEQTEGTVLTTEQSSVETEQTENSNEGETENSSSTESTNADENSDSGAGESSGTPPDTYAEFSMPDGMVVNETFFNEASPILKKLGASQEEAQSLMDIVAKQIQGDSQKQADDFSQLMSDWRGQSENDSEFGGDKFKENVKLAQFAISKYGTPELKQLLEDHGMGNHPEVVRFMVRIGNTLKEDVPGSSGNVTSKAEDQVSQLYPTT